MYYLEKIFGFKVKLSVNNGVIIYIFEVLEVILDIGYDILSICFFGDL